MHLPLVTCSVGFIFWFVLHLL